MDDSSNSDICRVCRSEGLPDRPLFHPCICTGSIKWIHQECLMQWMRYSRKEYCELCSHRFSFTPIYSPDMPRRLPLRDVAGGLLSSIATAVKYWFHYTLVAIAWLGVVPLTACRTYRCLFSGSLESIITLPLDVLTTQNIPSDVFHGCFVIICTLFAFMGMIWLREQIIHGGGPDWLERDQPQQQIVQEQVAQENAENLVEPANLIDAEINNDNTVGEHRPGPFPEPNAADNEDNNVLPVQPGAGPVEGIDPDAAENGQDEGNWNPIEWDRAVEELTWERLFGLDGSLVFLEYVFWVVSLNTLFIIIFAFCPYHFGSFAISAFGLREKTIGTHFEGLIATLCGYCVIGFCLVIFHSIASFLNFQKSRRILGYCYVVVKVSLLSVVEIGVLPLICGWWLDICTLAMFDATLKDRETGFKLAPGTSMFIHWLIGIIYVYYFASFVLLLREVLRPGVLWFLINLNDPDFSPIQELIHLPIIHHVRRLLASSVVFGTAVLLMLWLPVRILRAIWPSFLPYTVSWQSDTQVNELSLELLVLQIIIPALLDQPQSRVWMKTLIRLWCKSTAWALGIHSYLLGDEVESSNNAENVENNENNDNNDNDQGVFNRVGGHQALLPREGPIGVQPYQRPTWFYVRLLGLLIALFASLIIASLVALTLPVWIGRQLMVFWVGAPPVHELYTAASGTYFCWLVARAVTLLRSWLPQGRAAILEKMRLWCIWGLKSLVAFSVLLGVIPLLFGLLLELVIVIPLRVPLEQTPILFVWQDWALGVLYTKIACAVIMMGPNWSMQRAIERVYRDGIRHMDLQFIMVEIAMPVIACFGLALAVPYATAHGIVPLLISNLHVRNLIVRRLYPFLLIAFLAVGVVIFQIRQFKKLYEHIKNDKYLVGKRLVNYDHRRSHITNSSVQ
ncbi:ssm4 protein, putative [Pediculus humanus corporis]|uniref:E3 ubiquitin-protein ligase MARCHF6 n=1 Tax=Pediculus humanus subsp. corporis TaxID=121224 RepID=E0VYX2_PEDHC|nr:ssm4 protein, putative [Pediculus humanus corporis]EEB18578.1 ssm4 protein, putative [Pediculus humanus corporis]